MKIFYYKAKKGPTDPVEGKMYAANTREVVDKLVRQGYVATVVKEEKPDEKKDTIKSGVKWVFGVNARELIVFSRQLGRLIKAGLPILQSLDVLAEQTHDPHFKAAIRDIAENIKNGSNLSAALKEHPNIFSPFYRAMINAGESTGSLDLTMGRLADYYQRKYELVGKIRSALAYPALILIVGTFTLIFVFTRVIPKIMPLLENMSVKIPLSTRILMAISTFLCANWMWIVLFLVIFALIFSRAMANKAFKSGMSRFKLRLPILGQLTLKSEMAQFARAVSTAVKAGVPIIQAVNISMPVVSEYAIIEDVKKSVRGLESGGSFGDALKNSELFPPLVYNLIKIGEKSGNLEDALLSIAETYEADCEESVKTMTSLIEPVMILVMGGIVGFIVMAVLLPIMNLNVAGL